MNIYTFLYICNKNNTNAVLKQKVIQSLPDYYHNIARPTRGAKYAYFNLNLYFQIHDRSGDGPKYESCEWNVEFLWPVSF